MHILLLCVFLFLWGLYWVVLMFCFCFFFSAVMTEDASNFGLSILHLGCRHTPSMKTLCTLSEIWRPVSYHHFISWNMTKSKSKQLHSLYQAEGTRGSSAHSRNKKTLSALCGDSQASKKGCVFFSCLFRERFLFSCTLFAQNLENAPRSFLICETELNFAMGFAGCLVGKRRGQKYSWVCSFPYKIRLNILRAGERWRESDTRGVRNIRKQKENRSEQSKEEPRGQ